MHRILSMLLATLLTAVAVHAEDNVPPPGFQLLFNGKNLDGWQGLVELKDRHNKTPEQLRAMIEAANVRVLPHWTVKDGVLHYDGKGNSLQTVKDYYDFELLVDWKIGPKGDSGIYVRGQPQIQIWDNPIGSGGLYNNQRNPSNPLTVADKPVGEWNTFHVVVKKDRVTVKLNGVLVVDDVELENYWFRGMPLPVKGPIELQHHGDPLQFKNVFVKELE